jgi:hypothetical protein
MMEDSQVYIPKPISRRGEWTAWALALITGLTWAGLRFKGVNLPWPATFFIAFFWLAALSISFGNWMDCRTLLQLEAKGLTFQNGLRTVRLKWDEIRKVAVLPDRWGFKVRVVGKNTSFVFHFLSEVKLNGETKDSFGFSQGERILETILQSTGLKLAENRPDGQYYVQP